MYLMNAYTQTSMRQLQPCTFKREQEATFLAMKRNELNVFADNILGSVRK